MQRGAQTQGARVDVDVLRCGQGTLALKQPHRVTLNRQDGPHGDDAAALGGQYESPFVNRPGRQSGHDEDGASRPHGHLHA